MRNWLGRAMNVNVADGVVGAEIGAAPAAENVFASLVGDVVRELEDDAAVDGGTARMKDLDGAGKRRFGIRFFPGCSGSWVWCQGRWIVSEISWDCSRLSSLIRSGQRGLEVHAESGQTGMGGVSGSLEMPVERALQIACRKVSGRSVAKVMDPSRYCIAGSRSDQNVLRSPGSSLMFPMEKTEAVSRSMYAWWAAARHVSEQLLNAMWKVERVVSSTLVMAGRCQEISAPECCHAAIARWTATIRSTPSLTVRRQFGWECRALGSGLWTAFGEGFDGALPCFGALSEAVRRGEDGGGFGMGSGGGWSDAERARQALIQVDRNDPINHIPYREKAIRMGVSCSRKRSLDGFRGRLRWRVALLRCSVGSRRWKEFFRVPSGMRVADLW